MDIYLLASSNSNYLKVQDKIDANASWKITTTETGVATIQAQGSNTRNTLKYNQSSKLFSCYASGQKDVSIYKQIIGTEVTGSVTQYTNVDFRIMFGVETSKLSSLPEGANYKINIQTNSSNNKSFEFKNEKDGVKCIVFTLGDLIANASDAKIAFKVCLQVEFEGNTYTTVTRSISVIDLIKAYYENETTIDAVKDMYDYYTSQGLIVA